MNAIHLKLAMLTVVAGAVAAAPAFADDDAQPRRNGEHPVIIQNRILAKAGYDYASKFYLHPARLELLAEQPRELGDHPAVIVARAARAAREQTAALCAERLVSSK